MNLVEPVRPFILINLGTSVNIKNKKAIAKLYFTLWKLYKFNKPSQARFRYLRLVTVHKVPKHGT